MRQPTRAVGAEETTITIDDSTFTPAQITVPAGTKVTWVNNDDIPHMETLGHDHQCSELTRS